MSDLLRVLVVEDDPATRRAIVRALQSMEARVVLEECSDGLHACERLRGSYDAALLDYQLPGRNGLEILREVRAAGVRLPIIILTGRGDEELAVELMKAGASDYLSKSRMSPETLWQSLRNALRVHEAERKTAAAQEELRASNEQLEGIVRASPLAILTTDLQGNITSWNPAAERLFGWTAHEMIGHPPPSVAIDDDAQYRDLLQRSLVRGGLAGVEIRRRRKNGDLLDLNLYSALMHDVDGHTKGVIAIIEDITQAKRLQEQLLQAHRMETVGRLAGGIAHDFNNLLAVISGYSESLQRRMLPDDPLRQPAQEIERAADRGAALTRQLLAFSRRQAVEPRDLDLNPLVAGACQMLRRVISDKIEIKVQPESPLGIVKADPSQMEQVLINLALNARDAMPTGGILTITTANLDLSPDAALPHNLPAGRYVTLSVRDTGGGVTPEVQSRMFEPFFTTKDTMGTGLGLSIVYGIVEQAGGRIEVASQPGAGAVFEVILPRVGA